MPPAYKSVPAIEKCFAILDLFSKTEKSLGISEISKQLALNKSTVFNMVHTLVDLKVLDDPGDGKFGFGPLFFILGSASSKRSRLPNIVHPYLERINQETRLPAFLGIRSHIRAILIDKADWAHGITLSSAIGMQMPVLGGVGIKAMLSLLDQAEVEDLIGDTPLEKFTPYSITDKGDYLETINRVRTEGIAFDREEYVEGMVAAGVPIQPRNQQIQAAVWVVGLKRRLSEKLLLKEGELLKEMAREINQRLGG